MGGGIRRCGPAAHAINDHGMANLEIKLHSLHPPRESEGLAGVAPFITGILTSSPVSRQVRAQANSFSL